MYEHLSKQLILVSLLYVYPERTEHSDLFVSRLETDNIDTSTRLYTSLLYHWNFQNRHSAHRVDDLSLAAGLTMRFSSACVSLLVNKTYVQYTR